MKRDRFISALIFSMFLVVSHASAEVFELIDYAYYEIDNENNKVKLLDRIEEASTIRDEGVVRHSMTRWQVQWDFDVIEAQREGCKVGERRVNVNALIHLPELKGANDSALQDEFNRYAKQLQSHEVAHYMLFAIQAANEVELLLRNLPAGHNCQELKENGDTLAQQVIDTYLEKEREYDAVTNYGQGGT